MTTDSQVITLGSPQTCPNSCSVDSDCSGCGPNFVCENGQCIKQIPNALTSPLSTTISSYARFTTTVCYYAFVTTSKKCIIPSHLDGFTPDYANASFEVTAKDQNGRGIPGMTIDVVPALQNPATTSFTYKIKDANGTSTHSSGKNASGVTDSNGQIKITTYADAMPAGFQNISDSFYQASTAYKDNNTYGSQNTPYGNFTFTISGTNITSLTSIIDNVSYEGHNDETTGCKCL